MSDSLDGCGAVLGHLLQAPVVRVHNGPLVETVLDGWNPLNPSRFNLGNPLSYLPQPGLGGHHRPLVCLALPFSGSCAINC